MTDLVPGSGIFLIGGILGVSVILGLQVLAMHLCYRRYIRRLQRDLLERVQPMREQMAGRVGLGDQINLNQPAQLLANYSHLERFGGRYRTPLSGIYRATRRIVVSILNDHGDIRDDRTDKELFDAAAGHHPDHADRLQELFALRAFAFGDAPDPFVPVGPTALPRVEQLLGHASEVLNLAYLVRLNVL